MNEFITSLYIQIKKPYSDVTLHFKRYNKHLRIRGKIFLPGAFSGFGLKKINTWLGPPCMLGDTEKFIERRDEGNDT